MAGRWKGSPQGPYWDPNDTGPNQVDPPPGMSQQGTPTAPQGGSQPQPGTAQGPVLGGIPGGGGQFPPMYGGGDLKPWSETMPDGSGGYYNPGGHFDANGNKLPDPPMPDTSQWAHKQYPGGVGGPVQPMEGGPMGSLMQPSYSAKPGLGSAISNAVNGGLGGVPSGGSGGVGFGALGSMLRSPFGFKR